MASSTDPHVAVLVARADAQRHDHRNLRMVVDSLADEVLRLERELVTLRVRIYTLAGLIVLIAGVVSWGIDLAIR